MKMHPSQILVTALTQIENLESSRDSFLSPGPGMPALSEYWPVRLSTACHALLFTSIMPVVSRLRQMGTTLKSDLEPPPPPPSQQNEDLAGSRDRSVTGIRFV
jgi:hypothetical protein